MSSRIYLDHKEKKHVRDDAVKRSVGILQGKVANDVRQNNTLKYSFSNNNFNKGVEWFNSGLSLDEAPEELRKDGSFIKGFERGKTIKLINDTLYDTGVEYFEKGIVLDKIPEKYKNNEYFMDGYNSCNSRTK